MMARPTQNTVATSAATPIWISHRARRGLVGAGLVALMLVLWRAPTLMALVIGGAALALPLSIPVRAFSRVMPRGVAVALSVLLAAALIALAISVFAPILQDQLRALVAAVPGIAQQVDAQVPAVFRWFSTHGLLPGSTEQAVDEVQQRLTSTAQAFAGRLLGGVGTFVSGVSGVAIAVVGMSVVATYLLVDARRIKAAVLRASPHRYRRDVRALWDAFSQTLSRYIGGQAALMAIEGLLAAIAFHFLGVPYAFLMGAWVGMTAIIPNFGAWLGYAPAVLLALSVSPMRALITLPICLLNNVLVGNVLGPRIQGQVVQVHPLLVFLAVVAGGELFGIPGVLLAVPAVAVMRVLFDYLRARVRIREESPASLGAPPVSAP